MNDDNKGNKAWNEQSTLSVPIHQHNTSIVACAITADRTNKNYLIIASACSEGTIIVSRVGTAHVSKEDEQIDIEHLSTVKLQYIDDISDILKVDQHSVIVRGIRNNVVIVTLAGRENQIINYPNTLTQVKYMEQDWKIFTSSIDGKINMFSSVDMLNFNNSVIIDNGNKNAILAMDCLSIDNKFVFVYGDSHGKICTKIHNNNNNIQDNWFDNSCYTFHSQNNIGNFNENAIHCLLFSPNGNFIAAIGADKSMEIYHKNEKYDTFWNSSVVEWIFLDKIHLNEIHLNNDDEKKNDELKDLWLSWIDNRTCMIGSNRYDSLFVTQISEKEYSVSFMNAIINGVEIMIQSLQQFEMAWIGLKKDISNQIICYCGKWFIQRYQIKKEDKHAKVSYVKSCQYGKEYIPFDDKDEREIQKQKESLRPKFVYIHANNHTLYATFQCNKK